MYRTLQTADTIARPDALALVLYEKTVTLPDAYGKIDAASGGVLSAAIKRADFTPGGGSLIALHPPRGPRLFVLGLGAREQFQLNHLRAAASRLTPALHAAKCESVVVHFGPPVDGDTATLAFAEGLGLGGFVFDQFKGAAASQGKPKKSEGGRPLTVAGESKSARASLEYGLTLAESANIARDLAATPPNVASPAYVADFCRKMAREKKLKCTVIDAAKAKALKMGGLLAVGRAGSTPPALICLEWKPQATSRKSQAPVLIVGKAVTFDTGGYSIKPTDGMLPMKYDKSAGMAVIGLMHAVASLDLPVHVVGLIPAAENMIGSTAYRPSDILTLFNGVTVEVTNTDAEGRLILSDALAYGCKTYKPRAVIDMATLTGAIVVALGPWCAGLYCNDEELYDDLLAASESSGERVWRMPLWPEHRKHIKATHGDIANSAGRDAGACTAAAFLSHFVAKDGDFTENAKVPWAHIDIAGVSDVSTDRDPTGVYPKGPTGYGVRLLVNYMEHLERPERG